MAEAQQEGRGEVVLYQTSDGKAALDVRLAGNTVWLSQKQMAELFDKNVRTVSEHIRNVFKEGELDEPAVIRYFRITAADGKSYDTQFYNLDVIISVGYRYGETETGYLPHLMKTLYRHQAAVLGYGIKVWPEDFATLKAKAPETVSLEGLL